MLTAVIMTRSILTEQWKKTFNDFTDATVWIVGEKNPPPTCNVIICLNGRWNLIPRDLRDMVGTLIIDEAHMLCCGSCVDVLLAFQPKYIIIESATLERDDDLHLMMYTLAGIHGVYRESNTTLTVVKINTGISTEITYQGFGPYQRPNYGKLVKDTLMNEYRNHIILELVKANAHRKILILTGLIDHAKHLNNLIVKANITSDYMCADKKTYTDANVLVGTTNKIGTGFDQATFCEHYDKRFDLLILVRSIKKYQMLVQNVGRIFRTPHPTVFHFVDDVNIFREHWKKCIKWYNIRKANILEHTVPTVKSVENKMESSQSGSVLQDWLEMKIATIAK
jgi:superfamily II DNA or RNA helicase